MRRALRFARFLVALIPFPAPILGCAPAKPAAPPPSAESPLLGADAPSWKRSTLDGSTVDTAALRGRVTVIDFFAEHCAPCARSLPTLAALHRSRPDVAFVGVSEDEDDAQAKRVLAKHGLGFPVVRDESRAIAGRFRVTDLPATFVIDARGKVRWVSKTAAGEDELRAAIDTAHDSVSP